MRVYLDNAATTPVDPRVRRAMIPYFGEKFGNASEPHQWGREARAAIDKARDQVAKALNCRAQEIFFTSCATESINLSHKGLAEALLSSFKAGKVHIITTPLEHKAVLEVCKHLEKLGLAEITFLSVDKSGLIDTGEVEKLIRPETILISVMFVNNEVGTIEPVEEIGGLIRRINNLRAEEKRPPVYFHTDATQAIQYLECDVEKIGCDLLSLTGHKFYAPKGVGALYVRKGTPLVRQQDGGGQEYQLRSGTENVTGIVGLGKAIELITSEREEVSQGVRMLRNRLIKGVLKITGVKLTGHPKTRVPHIASFVFKGVEGEAILLGLDQEGIAASSGSACTSGLLEPSHVLTAMGIPPELSHGSLRFSLGKESTQKEIDYVLEKLPPIIERLRKMAPK